MELFLRMVGTWLRQNLSRFIHSKSSQRGTEIRSTVPSESQLPDRVERPSCIELSAKEPKPTELPREAKNYVAIPVNCPSCGKILMQKSSIDRKNIIFSCSNCRKYQGLRSRVHILFTNEGEIRQLIVRFDDGYELQVNYSVSKAEPYTKITYYPVGEKDWVGTQVIVNLPTAVYVEITKEAIRNKIQTLLVFS